jgi:SAM-dependent methyltransferase
MKFKTLKIIRDFVFSFFKKKNFGYCCVCESKTLFIEKTDWLREDYKCIRCGSSPRQRSLINALNEFYPDWKNQIIHESSPSTVSSLLLKSKCKDYTSSHFYPDMLPGSYHGEHRCENLSGMTFKNETFDLLVTQDVFEHVIEPIEAFKEIGRVLKKGGAHVFTLGWAPENKISKPRSILKNNQIVHIEPPMYHGNPIDKDGSLVTWDWGPDIVDIIYKQSGMVTTIVSVHDRLRGLDGETIEVFISRKSSL